MNVRSRLLAKQINTGKEQGLFAATPPLEALRMLLTATVTGFKPKVLMLNDVRRAKMYVRTTSDMYVSCAKTTTPSWATRTDAGSLQSRCMETKAAAHDWQLEVTRTMEDLGLKQSKASPCVFWHRQRDISAHVRGDDFVSSGERSVLEWLCKGLKKKFDTKMTMVGEDDDLAKEARVLNGIVRWHPRKRITYEAERRSSRPSQRRLKKKQGEKQRRRRDMI